MNASTHAQNRRRQPPGSPRGGEFAAEGRTESGATLGWGIWPAGADRSMRCNGICLSASEVGVGAPGVAVPHPDCDLHGATPMSEPLAVAWCHEVVRRRLDPEQLNELVKHDLWAYAGCAREGLDDRRERILRHSRAIVRLSHARWIAAEVAAAGDGLYGPTERSECAGERDLADLRIARHAEQTVRIGRGWESPEQCIVDLGSCGGSSRTVYAPPLVTPGGASPGRCHFCAEPATVTVVEDCDLGQQALAVCDLHQTKAFS